MAGKWVTRKIGSLGRIVTGKTPSTGDQSNFGGPYPFITIPDLDGRVLIDRTERSLSEQSANILNSCLLPPSAVMMSCIATIGRCGITTRPSFTNQQINSVIPSGQFDSRFLYYVFTQLGHELESVGGGGSVYTNVSKSRFSDIEVVIPENLKEQRAIAHILGTLDDKIDLNRRMSETLEAMARALFKSWFVDFDPVRAKAEGRDPGLPKHLADLFPARLVDSELGEIPEGWEVGTLPKVIEVNPSRVLRKGDVAPYLDMANMPTRGHTPDSLIDRPFGSGMRFVNGDTLVARITPCLENGKTAYVDFLERGQVGWGSTEYIVLRPKPPLPPEFAYCLARGSEFRDFAIQSMTGSSGRQRVPAESLSHFQVIVAPKTIAEMFGHVIEPLFARAAAAARQSTILAALRDTLLPKLISGELRVDPVSLQSP
ncbi:MAG TPA: restriction endonuclease subunit S [Bacillota bacterium]|nr:restriction endonuclease subunit S [Bacillota bacterium]